MSIHDFEEIPFVPPVEEKAEVVEPPASQYLVQAAYDGNFEDVKKYVTPEIVNAVDMDGNSALMWAAFRNHCEIMTFLLHHDELEVNVNLQNKYGRTAIMLAVQNMSNDAAQLLARYGADLIIKDQWNADVGSLCDSTRTLTAVVAGYSELILTPCLDVTSMLLVVSFL
jgi:hypothetical protein